MIKYIFRSFFLLPAVLLLAAAGCKKSKGLDSPDLLVYMQGNFGDVNNAITASLTQTPVSVWGNKVFQLPVYSTRQMVVPMTVSVSPDSTSVAAFNQLIGKKCVLMPTGTYTIDLSQLTIPADSMVSNPLTVTITNAAALTDTNGYVLPLTIEKVSGGDHGVAISSNRATAYLYVPYAFTNIDTVDAALTGMLLTRTGWNVTVSNTTNGDPAANIVDGSNSTVWRSSNSSTAAKYVIVNMKSQQTAGGFQLTPDYVATGDNPTEIRVSTSADSITWTVQGVWTGTLPATGTSAASPDLKYIDFLAPVQTQYFRFDILAWGSGSRTGLAELNVVE